MIPTLAERSRQRQRRALALGLDLRSDRIPTEPPLGLAAYLAAAADAQAERSAQPAAEAAHEALVVISAVAAACDADEPGLSETEAVVAVEDRGMVEAACVTEAACLAEAVAETETEAETVAVAETIAGTVTERAEPLRAGGGQRSAAVDLLLWLLLLLLDGGLAALEFGQPLLSSDHDSPRPVRQPRRRGNQAAERRAPMASGAAAGA